MRSDRYGRELVRLGATYSTAQALDVSALRAAIDTLRARPLVLVGSGGSLTACHFTARLHEAHARLPARVLTPLEFVKAPTLQNVGVLLVSARGDNPDILAAAEHAVTGEYTEIAGVCARTSSPLHILLASHRHATVFEFQNPAGKDGFLATNSLVLFFTVLARAYGVMLPYELPALGHEVTAETSTIARELVRPSMIVLASGWSQPAAIDLESKWSEAGFGSVSVTDERNFAHGRHYGLYRRLSSTVVLGVATPDEERLCELTFSHLPRQAHTALLRTSLTGAAGALDLLVRVLNLVAVAGRIARTDPGRPKVRPFGTALYQARYLEGIRKRDASGHPEDVWIRRKVTLEVWEHATDDRKAEWRKRCRAWVAGIESARIGGLAIDYDGTLCEAYERFGKPARMIGQALCGLIEKGMFVGIATGRGDSVLEALRAVLPRRQWKRVLVGMYNGGSLVRLRESLSNCEIISAELSDAYNILAESPILAGIAEVRVRSGQVTVRSCVPLPEGVLTRFVREALARRSSQLMINILESSHSVDVLGRCTSKMTVVDAIRRELDAAGGGSLTIMTIGDQGQAGGNDAAFLAHQLGLSVDYASSMLDSCWHIAPQGSRRTSALLRYLNALSLDQDGGFRFSVKIAAGLAATGRQVRSPKARRRSPVSKSPDSSQRQ